MTTRLTKHLLWVAAATLLPCAMALAQGVSNAPATGAGNAATPDATKASFDRAINGKSDWYFSWGYSRQQYAPS